MPPDLAQRDGMADEQVAVLAPEQVEVKGADAGAVQHADRLLGDDRVGHARRRRAAEGAVRVDLEGGSGAAGRGHVCAARATARP